MTGLASTLATIWRLAVPYFRSEDRWRGRLLLAAVIAHAFFLLCFGGLPRWAGVIFLAAYGWFVWTGLLT